MFENDEYFETSLSHIPVPFVFAFEFPNVLFITSSITSGRIFASSFCSSKVRAGALPVPKETTASPKNVYESWNMTHSAEV